MASNNLTSEVAKVLAYDGSSGLSDVSTLRAGVSAAVGAGQPDTTPATTQVAGTAITDLGDAVRQNSEQVSQLKSAFQSQIDSTVENTRALVENTTSKEQGAGSAIGDVAKSIRSTIAGSFALSPIVSGIMKLFGGGGDSSTPPLVVKYAPPPAIQLQAGISGGQLSGIDYSATGQPRSMSPAAQTSTSNVTVNVQAIDSRSFLDYSDAIAAAVKKAMLDSNSLNDVVSEL